VLIPQNSLFQQQQQWFEVNTNNLEMRPQMCPCSCYNSLLVADLKIKKVYIMISCAEHLTVETCFQVCNASFS